MNISTLYVIIGTILCLIIEAFIISAYKDMRWKKVIQYIVKNKLDKYTEKSKRVIRGHIKEQFVPFTPKWGDMSISEAHFLGAPIDYIVFDGLEYGKIPEIILVEVKTGKAKQNRNEQLVEQAVKEKRLRYVVLNI